MERTEDIYGELPVDLGFIDLDCKEMMYWLYLPVKLPYSKVVVPPNLEKYLPLLEVVENDLGNWQDKFVYITAKTLWVGKGNLGNRPGWHSDGFLTDDLNYIWCDKNPTLFFYNGDQRYSFSKHHEDSLVEMNNTCSHSYYPVKYPEKHLLKLDERVLHKVDPDVEEGIRTFVKVSVSRHPYKMIGNSINHELTGDWLDTERSLSRNCPAGLGEH